MNDIPLTILLIILFLLVMISGFFSASETSMMSLNRYKLRHLAKTSATAKKISKLLARPDRLLGIILIGNNFVNILASSIATIAAIRIWGNTGLAISIATGLTTIILLIFAETTPKTLAALKPERVAFFAYFPLRLLLWILYPLVWCLNIPSNNILKLVGINSYSQSKDTLNTEELKTLLHETNPMLSRHRREMLLSILELSEVTVNDIMIPYNDIHGINIDDKLNVISNKLLYNINTTLPIYKKDLNNIIGMLNIKYIPQLLNNNSLTLDKLLSLLSEPYFIPEGTSLYNQLIHFQNKNSHTAFIVNEYGDILGLITIADILDEIIGNLNNDTQDIFQRMIHDQKDGSYIIDCSITIRDLNKIMGWQLPVSGPKTLNGLIIEHYEEIPQQGICLLIAAYPIEIINVHGNSVRIARISAQLPIELE